MNPDERPLIPSEYAKAYMENHFEEIQRIVSRIPVATEIRMYPKSIRIGVQPQSTATNPTDAETCYVIGYQPVYHTLAVEDIEFARRVGKRVIDKINLIEEAYYFGHVPSLDILPRISEPTECRQCSICHGSGRTRGRSCYGCKGSGQIVKGRKKAAK